MDDLAFVSAVELGALLRERQISAVEAVEGALRRIEAGEPRIRAFAEVDAEAALAQARALPGEDRRLFAGVPIAVKANTPVAGLTMDYGSRLLAGNRMSHDAHLVRRLRDEGFVIVGTTRMPELGILPTTEPRHGGPARNPWDTSRTPGGSSGGAAAAVASGMLPIAHGNDGGGSLRIPAACCGLVGLKPSRGRVSRGPDAGDSFLGCDGVLSRTVLDTAAALDVLAGYEVGDATWAPPPVRPYSSVVREDPGRLRVAVTTDSPLGGDVDTESRRAVQEAAELLASLGHDVEPLGARLPGGEDFEVFVDVFSANVALGFAYAQSLAGRPAREEDVEPLSRVLVARAVARNSVQLLAAQSRLQHVARRVVARWAECDVVLTPALAQRPPAIGTLHGGLEDAIEAAAAFTPFAGLFNMTGQPAISLPLGTGADGLPTGVQLVGPPLGEDTLLQLAAQLESARPWAQRRPQPVPAST